MLTIRMAPGSGSQLRKPLRLGRPLRHCPALLAPEAVWGSRIVCPAVRYARVLLLASASVNASIERLSTPQASGGLCCCRAGTAEACVPSLAMATGSAGECLLRSLHRCSRACGMPYGTGCLRESGPSSPVVDPVADPGRRIRRLRGSAPVSGSLLLSQVGRPPGSPRQLA
jgi:hypothetical protein